jgi:hypothetical protein
MLTVAVDVCVLISPQSTSNWESRNGEVQSERHYMTAGDGDFQLRRSLKKHQEFGKIVSGFLWRTEEKCAQFTISTGILL